MKTTEESWKSGRVVRLLSGGEVLQVIGRDSVGSVICRPLSDQRHLGIYVPPSLLISADPEPDSGAPRHSTEFAAENQ